MATHHNTSLDQKLRPNISTPKTPAVQAAQKTTITKLHEQVASGDRLPITRVKEVLYEAARDCMVEHGFDPIKRMMDAVNEMDEHLTANYDKLLPMERQRIMEAIFTACDRLANYAYSKAAAIHQTAKITAEMPYEEVLSRMMAAAEHKHFQNKEKEFLNPRYGHTVESIEKVIDQTTPGSPKRRRKPKE